MSDYHKLISTLFKSHFKRLRPKVITHRNYTKFDENLFLNDLQKLDIKLDAENSQSSYLLISNKFLEVVNKHAPLKKKVLRGNHSPFCNQEISKSYLHKKQIEKQNESKSFQGKCIGV